MWQSKKTWSLTAAAALLMTTGALAGTPFTESFEALNPGQLDGQGGWHGWGGSNTAFADVVITQNHTGGGTKSAELRAGADSVTEPTATSGHWIITAWTFAPTAFIGKTYFIVLNTYADLGPFEWGVQVGFNGDTGRIECDCGATTPAQRALVRGAWADLVVDIDLATGTTSVYYDTANDPNPLATYQWTNGVFGQDNFASISIDAIDLYPDAVGFPQVTPFYFDDISIEPAGPPAPGTQLCFGDGTATQCPCANNSTAGSGGCRNSVSGTSGALYSATGTASVSAPNLTLDCANVRTQPGLHFQGNNTILGGMGQVFGDGLRCCGGSVIRLQLEDPPPAAEPVSVTTTLTVTPSGITPGTKRCYQYWYRDPGGLCGTNFNLSNAITVTWGA